MDSKKLPSSLTQKSTIENNVQEGREKTEPTSEVPRQKGTSHDNDKWVIGFDGNKTFVVPTATVPNLVLDALKQPKECSVLSGESAYDRSKFSLTQLSASKNSRVEIALSKVGGGFADVMHDRNGFVITVPELFEFKDAPFTGDEFIKAIQAAKFQYTKFLLRSDSEGHDS